MKVLICSVRVRSCVSISGTVSGIGTGTSAGSTPDEEVDTAASGMGAGAGRGVEGCSTGVALVRRGSATGSFENFSNAKSNTCSGSFGLNVTFAVICAGSGSFPICASRYRPLRTKGTAEISFVVRVAASNLWFVTMRAET